MKTRTRAFLWWCKVAFWWLIFVGVMLLILLFFWQHLTPESWRL